MSYIVIFTQEEDGSFSGLVPELPGCFSQGRTLPEAKKNIQEAIELYLEDETIEEKQSSRIQVVASVDVPVKK